MKVLKKISLVVITLFICFTFISCNESEKSFTLDRADEVFCVNEKFELNSSIKKNEFSSSYYHNVSYKSSDPDVVSIDGYQGECKKIGFCEITAYDSNNKEIKKSSIKISVISNEITSISLSGAEKIKVGSNYELSFIKTPSKSNIEVGFRSSDEDVATVSSDGVVTGVSKGYVTITCYSTENPSIYGEHNILVEEKDVETEYMTNEVINTTVTVDSSNLNGLIEPLIKKNISSLVGIVSEKRVSNGFFGYTQQYSGTGTIYKRCCVYSDNNIVVDDGNQTNYKKFRYYVITCKHLVDGCSSIFITYNNELIDATVCCSDSKIDLSVLYFESEDYIQTVKFADSDTLNTGDFVISIGNCYSVSFNDSASLGVVSFNKRYVKSDVDNDGQYDWDQLYIQHDCSISDSSSGGVLINLKGEVVGINSTKINSTKIDNMGFAIPSNLVLTIVSFLEKGIIPDRAQLNITIVSIQNIINKNLEYDIPSDLDYGYYVVRVSEGGKASLYDIRVGDIILTLNGKKLVYNYDYTSVLNEIIVGSGKEVEFVIYRDFEYITKKVVF